MASTEQPLSPYIYISPDIKSAQLRQKHPFTWLNIMSVTSKSVKRRNYLGDRAKAVLIQKVVAGGESSLDLLLGTLTFINWFATILLLRLKHYDTDLC